jgi:hypothetical protein
MQGIWLFVHLCAREGDRVYDLETDVDLEGGKPDVTTNFSVVATKYNKGAPQ